MSQLNVQAPQPCVRLQIITREKEMEREYLSLELVLVVTIRYQESHPCHTLLLSVLQITLFILLMKQNLFNRKVLKHNSSSQMCLFPTLEVLSCVTLWFCQNVWSQESA